MRTWCALLLVCMLAGNATLAQVLDPVDWSTEFKKQSDSEYNLIFKATIQKGWSIYSQYLESDDGPVRTSFVFDQGNHFELVGKNEESGNRKEGFDKLFEMNVIKFSKKAQFTQRIKVSDFSKPITGYFEFMTCDETRCLPPEQIDFDFSIPAPATDSEDTGALEKKPSPAPQTPAEPTKKTDTPLHEKVATTDPPKPESPSAEPGTSEAIPADKLADQTDQQATAPPQNAAPDGILDPVSWHYQIKKIDDRTFDMLYTAKIDDGWYIYSQQLESDDGPIPTAFYFDEDEAFQYIGKTLEEGPKRVKEYDRNFEMELVKYKKEATFTQRVQVSDPSKPFKGELEYMTCEATRCLPPVLVPFTADLTNLTTIIGDEAEEPVALNNGAAVDPGSLLKIDGNVIDQAIPTIQASYKNPVGDCGKEDIAEGQSLIWTFVLGFLGGLIALLTPCVFPMIPLTVSFFTKGSKTRSEGIRNGITYGISIIVIYVAIGLLITAFFGATALNELSTNWVANTLFFVIFVAFAFSFFGFYELTLPSSWSTKSDAMADRGGLLGTFFMAFTLAIVSFSCTGPIIGSAIVQSATSAVGPFIVMLGFSTALALPFGLFAAFPAMLNTLPSSGSWMNSVKVVLGFLELALALKFLSVADMTMHWGILGYELFMGLWVLIFGAMTLYLFGYIRFPHDSPLKKLSPTRIGFAVASLAITIYLATGFMMNEKTKVYDSLSLMSGLAPPAHYNYLLPVSRPNADIKTRYTSFTKCANNLDCFKDYYEGLAYAKEVNKPILLDFTGYGCVNCRKTEEHIWIEDQVWNKIAEDFVLISLYVDDRAALEQMLVSKATNKKLRNIGNKWADFQIVNFNQNSQPLYVMMSPEQKVLAKPRGYKDGVEEYAEFLECGLATFKNAKIGMK